MSAAWPSPPPTLASPDLLGHVHQSLDKCAYALYTTQDEQL